MNLETKPTNAQFLLALNDQLRRLTDPVAIEGEACRLLVNALDAGRMAFLDIDEANQLIVIKRDAVRNGSTSTVGRHPLADYAWAVDVLRQGGTLVVEDTQNSPLVPLDSRGPCAALEVIACMAVPVIKGNHLVGALCVNGPAPRQWQSAEIWLLEDVAERLWATILQARTEQALRDKTRELELQAEQLRRLASELTLAEHNTRQLLSRTLHDGLQQQLFSAKMALDEALRRDADNPLIQQAIAILQDAVASARSLSIEVFPPVLHNDGLPDALGWVVSWARRRYGLSVRVVADPEADPQALDTRILLFESVRELVFNAVKHAQVTALDIALSLEPGDWVQVRVSDDGVGFDVAYALQRAISDHGLGLMSIRERLRLLGGEMQVDSRPGSGSRFWLRVPRQSSTRELAQALAPPSPMGLTSCKALAPGLDPLRVLIADDHALVRNGLRTLFEPRLELQVVGEAVDGAEAVRKAFELQPDVVVMDVYMPVLDGIQATRAIKSELPWITVLGLSTHEEDRVHPIETAGASGYYSKQADSGALVSRLVAEYSARKALPPRTSPANL